MVQHHGMCGMCTYQHHMQQVEDSTHNCHYTAYTTYSQCIFQHGMVWCHTVYSTISPFHYYHNTPGLECLQSSQYRKLGKTPPSPPGCIIGFAMIAPPTCYHTCHTSIPVRGVPIPYCSSTILPFHTIPYHTIPSSLGSAPPMQAFINPTVTAVQ